VGILSWFRSRRSAAAAAENAGTVEEPVNPDEPPSLIKLRYEDPALEEIEEAAADDVARVQQDDRYFRADTPADHDEL
jgi:hypothetical protein